MSIVSWERVGWILKRMDKILEAEYIAEFVCLKHQQTELQK